LDIYYERDSHTYRDAFDRDKHKPSLYHYAELRSAKPTDKEFAALDSEKVLEKWAAYVRREALQSERNENSPKPPLIIVTSSGGASNSAIFTLNVLLELEQMHPGISRHIRIVSGASGGMFGSAYFRSQLKDIRAHPDLLVDPQPRGDVAFDHYRWKISQDFL